MPKEKGKSRKRKRRAHDDEDDDDNDIPPIVVKDEDEYKPQLAFECNDIGERERRSSSRAPPSKRVKIEIDEDQEIQIIPKAKKQKIS